MYLLFIHLVFELKSQVCDYAACGSKSRDTFSNAEIVLQFSAIVPAACNYIHVILLFRMATELANKKAEREALRGVIQQWNANRLDLFELSEPNEVSVTDDLTHLYFARLSLPQIQSSYTIFFSTGPGVSRRDEVLFPR